MHRMSEPAAAAQKLPPQVPFIIGNEACERFSFYGMRNILTVFLIDYLLVNEVPNEAARTALAKSTVAPQDALLHPAARVSL